MILNDIVCSVFLVRVCVWYTTTSPLRNRLFRTPTVIPRYGPVHITATLVNLTDEDHTFLINATIRLLSAPDHEKEQLLANVSGTAIIANYTSYVNENRGPGEGKVSAFSLFLCQYFFSHCLLQDPSLQ